MGLPNDPTMTLPSPCLLTQSHSDQSYHRRDGGGGGGGGGGGAPPPPTGARLLSRSVSLVEQANLAVGEHDVKEGQVGHAAVKDPGGGVIGAPAHMDGVAQIYGGAPSDLPMLTALASYRVGVIRGKGGGKGGGVSFGLLCHRLVKSYGRAINFVHALRPPHPPRTRIPWKFGDWDCKWCVHSSAQLPAFCKYWSASSPSGPHHLCQKRRTAKHSQAPLYNSMIW